MEPQLSVICFLHNTLDRSIVYVLCIRYFNCDRQSRTNRELARVPQEKYKHIRISSKYMELFGSGRRGVRVWTFLEEVQVPKAHDSHTNPRNLMHRPSPYRLRCQKRALRRLRHNRVLLRSPMAVTFRYNFGAFRAEILLHFVQFRVSGEPNWPVCAEREGDGAFVW